MLQVKEFQAFEIVRCDGIAECSAGARPTMRIPSRVRHKQGGVELRVRLYCRSGVMREEPAAETTVTIDGRPPPVRDDLIAGARLTERYVLVKPRGRGGMGVVWVARDTELERDVAIKLVRAALTADGEGRLRREAQAMAKLAHPGLVPVFDIGIAADGQRFVVMPLMASTLRQWIAEARRGWREIVRALLPALRGLAEAHRAGLVHRDIKPDNILLDDAGGCSVSDFGLAGDASAAETYGGTPGYMAPEQLRGERADAGSDQFAFCATAWEAVFGVRPFGPNSEAHAAAFSRGDVEPPLARGERKAPRHVELALRMGLAVDPARRHADLDSLADALDRALRRTRLGVWLAGGIALATCIAVGAMLLGRDQAGPSRGGEPPMLRVEPLLRSAELPAQPLLAGAREGDAIALGWTGAAAIQLLERGSAPERAVLVPDGGTLEAIALDAAGKHLFVCSSREAAYTLWRAEVATGTVMPLATLPRLRDRGVEVVENPVGVVVTDAGDLIVTTSGPEIYRVSDRGEVSVIARTGTLRSLRPRPGGGFSVMVRESLDLWVYGDDGEVVTRFPATFPDGPEWYSYDWLARDQVVVAVQHTGRRTELETFAVGDDGRLSRLGTLGQSEEILETPVRIRGGLLVGTRQQSSHLLVTRFGTPGMTSLDEGSMVLNGLPIWMLADQILVMITGLEEHALAALSPEPGRAPEVLVRSVVQDPIYAAGDRIVVGPREAPPRPVCGVTAYVRGQHERTLPLPCGPDPALTCGSSSPHSCVIARNEGTTRVYHRFDPLALKIGDVVFVDDAPVTAFVTTFAVSFGGDLIAIAHGSHGLTFVELATGRRTDIDSRGSTWQTACFRRDGRSVLVTSFDTALRSSLIEVALDGTITTHAVAASGFLAGCAVAPGGQRAVTNHLKTLSAAGYIELRR